MKRKSVNLLNVLRTDVEDVMHDIQEMGIDIEAAATNLTMQPVCNLTSPDDNMKEEFNELVLRHRDMTKLLQTFRKVRAAYMEFF